MEVAPCHFGDRVPECRNAFPLVLFRAQSLRPSSIERRRCPLIQTLMQTLLIVEAQIVFNAGAGLRHRGVVFEVHLLLFGERSVNRIL